jgi:hypothetical protein
LKAEEYVTRTRDFPENQRIDMVQIKWNALYRLKFWESAFKIQHPFLKSSFIFFGLQNFPVYHLMSIMKISFCSFKALKGEIMEIKGNIMICCGMTLHGLCLDLYSTQF